MYRIIRNRSLFRQEGFQAVRNVCVRSLCTNPNQDEGLHTRWKDQADTVIIGGGAVGTGLAYHLAKKGLKDVILLEKLNLTSGSTWHAAGLTTHYHPVIGAKRVHYESVKLYQQLEKETGKEVGFHLTGSIRLTCNPFKVDEMKHQTSRHRWNQARQMVIGPDEIRKLHPLVNIDGVLAGLHNPDDGHVDPYSLTQSLATGARLYGAEIYQSAPVTATTQRSDGTWDVTTPEGTIHAKRIVNAGGFHGREVGKLSGLDLPICAVHHEYIVTATIPEITELKQELPVIRDMDGSYYCRQERLGLLMGPYETADRMKIMEEWYDNGPPKEFGQELFEDDLDRIAPHTEKAIERIPVLQSAEIQSVVNGPITYTTDGLPMVGPFQGLDNYWCMIGFGFGIIETGGIGDYLSEWMLKGEPPYELSEFDPSRYSTWTDRDFLMAKIRETYGATYSPVIHHDESYRAGRPSKRVSGLYNVLKGKGAQFGHRAGWEVPTWFARDGDEAGDRPSFHRTNWFHPVGREVKLVRSAVGLTDLTSFAKLLVTGPDAVPFMNHVSANFVPKVGKTKISHLLTPKGKVYAEMTVTQIEQNTFFCITGAASELHDLRWLEQHSKNFDVKLANVTDEYGAIGLAGPKSRDVLTKITSSDLSDQAFPFLSHKEITVGSVPTKAVRISYTGELGWELYVPINRSEEVYNALCEAGQQYEIGDFGAYAMNTLRLEKGFRAWKTEMSTDTNPFEAGLGNFIKINKETDFIGKEAVTRMKNEPLKRQLVLLSVDTQDVDPVGDESIWYNDQVVGMVTSGTYSHTTGQSICYAYIPSPVLERTKEVQVEMVGTNHVHLYEAKIIQEPLVS